MCSLKGAPASLALGAHANRQVSIIVHFSWIQIVWFSVRFRSISAITPSTPAPDSPGGAREGGREGPPKIDRKPIDIEMAWIQEELVVFVLAASCGHVAGFLQEAPGDAWDPQWPL